MRPALAMLVLAMAFGGGCSLPDCPLVVVHVERQWSGAERVASGIASLARGREVYLLTTEPGDWRSTSLMPSIKPSKVVVAPGGEWEGLALPGGRAEFCGAYLRACLATAARAVVRRSPGVTIVLPMRCVLHGESRTLEEVLRDNWHGDADAFLGYMEEEVAPNFGLSRPVASIEGGLLLLRESAILRNKARWQP